MTEIYRLIELTSDNGVRPWGAVLRRLLPVGAANDEPAEVILRWDRLPAEMREILRGEAPANFRVTIERVPDPPPPSLPLDALADPPCGVPTTQFRYKDGCLQQRVNDARGGGAHQWIYVPHVTRDAPDVVGDRSWVGIGEIKR